jgi:hypothetical protein
LPATITAPSQDATAFAAVGTQGIGDIDLTEDGNTLWVVNLFNRSLIKLNVTNGATPTSATEYLLSSMGEPSCTGGVLRPWALKFHNGKGYIGAVCSAETSNTRNDLVGRVMSFDPSNPTTLTVEVTIPLNGRHGDANSTAYDPIDQYWNPWRNTYNRADLGQACCGYGGVIFVSRPTPILSDIEFDSKGAMIIGIMDRMGMQIGAANYEPISTQLIDYQQAGDILRACPNASGQFILENAGVCGGVTGFSTTNNNGPGGGEFYFDNVLDPYHFEGSNGGIAQLPGANEVVYTAEDPLGAIWTGGMIWVSNTNGAKVRANQIFSGRNSDTGLFGKAVGLGDIEVVCDTAPIEIGNRVWRDDNANGVQDPGEPGIAGVTVRLYDSGGTLITDATAVTDANGNYYFSSALGTNTTSAKYNLPILPNTDYVVRVNNSTDFTSGPLAGLALTATNADASANGDTRDSDAIQQSATSVRIDLTTGAAGANNHTYDFGFFPTVNLGNLVWNDIDNDGVKDAGESGIDGVTVNLYRDSDNDGTPDGASVATTTTAGGGLYNFTGLSADTYIVEVVPTSGYISSTGANGAASGPYEGAATPDPDNNIDNDDNGTTDGAVIRSKPITLTAGGEPAAGVDGDGTNGNLTVDFGLFQPFSLGNRVWEDPNNNGTQDAGETGISGVTVNLYRDSNDDGTPDGAVIATTTTDASGYYRFDYLVADTYIVEVVTPGGYVSSTANAGDPDTDVDDRDDNGVVVAVTTVRTNPITLGPAASEPTGETDLSASGQGADDARANMTVDFGFFRPFSLGNRVWNDLDNDGTQDAAEVGIGAVEVRLLDSAGATTLLTTTTDTNGYYRFDNLPAGDYIVEIVTPGGYASSTNGEEADPNSDGDGNDNGVTVGATTVRSAVVTLGTDATPAEPTGESDVSGSGQGADDNRANMTVDFGFWLPYSLGNRVWNDLDNDGTQDAAEVGIGAVEVRLLDSAGATAILTTTTDASGYYRFDNLEPDDYIVEVVTPSGFVSSTNGEEADPDSDGDRNDNGVNVLTTIVRSGVVTLGPGAGEPTGESDVSGSGQGVADNRANMTVDFGFFQPLSLGNRVWEDVNNDGELTGGETGIGSVPVRLYRDSNNDGAPDGAAILTTTTSATGYYSFTGLISDTYIVEIMPPAGYLSSSGANGSTAGIYEPASDPDNDIDNGDNGTTFGAVIRSRPVTLIAGSEPNGEENGGGDTTLDASGNLTVDFGLFQPFSLGNRVWQDDDNSGTINGSEGGIGSVAVSLLDSAGTTVISTTTTDVSGYYRFDNLIAGDYRVRIDSTNFGTGGPLIGLGNSTNGEEADPNTGGDGNDNGVNNAAPAVNGITSGVVTLGPGASEPTGESDVSASGQGAFDARANMTVDFGFYPSYSLGNRLWHDADNDGTVNGSESGIDGVTVELWAADAAGVPIGATPLLTQTTNTDGYYLFTGMQPGDYVVVIPTGNFTGTGVLTGFFSSGVTQGAAEAAASTDTTAGGTNNDHGTTLTAASGAVPAGAVISNKYTLGVGQPIGEDGNATPGHPDGTPDNRSNLTADFGFYTMSLGNIVWTDADNDGTKDPSENGVAGVRVNLYADADGDGAPDGATAIAAMDTDATGRYLFTGLVEGKYVIELTNLPAGAISSTGVSGSATGPYEPGIAESNNAADEEQDHGTQQSATAIRSGTITLAAGAEPASETDGTLPTSVTTNPATDANTNTTVDFGIFTPYSLGNRVWFDLNNNGIIDTGETGIGGVQVRLLDSAGATTIITTTTNVDGYYRFDTLPAGDYLVEVGTPNGHISSTNGDEANPNTDADGNDNGVTVGATTVRSGIVTLGGASEPIGESDLSPSGQGTDDNRANMTVDFGFTQPVALGNAVWFDADNDGVFDAAESGIGDVTVLLFREGTSTLTGTATLTTTTDASGFYLFDNVPPGRYFVHIPANEFQAGGDLAGRLSSTGAGVSESADDNVDENGIDSTTAATDGISSMVYELLPNSEPTSEAGEGSYTGSLDDDNVNLTADFGFYEPVALGNLVWLDVNNDGVKDAGESGIPGVTLQLFREGTSPLTGTAVLTTTTDSSGRYIFDNLTPSDYFVFIPPSHFQAGGALNRAASSTGNGTSETDDQDVDENGIDDTDPATNGIRSVTYILQANSEPTGDDDTGYSGSLDDDNVNLTADFGFYLEVALGNRVWFDADNDGVKDATENGISGVEIRLFNAGDNPLTGTAVLTTTTDSDGVYIFDNLTPGDYFVFIPPSEFQSADPLAGHFSSTGNGISEALDENTDENGIDNADPATDGIRSIVYTLLPNSEPLGDDDTGYTGILDDDNVNLTADFGFYTPVSLGNLVWHDADNDGVKDAGENGINMVAVELYTTGAEPGLDSPIATTTTVDGGFYSFEDLAPGVYFVYIPNPPANFPTSSGPTDTNDNGEDNDDNGEQITSGDSVRSPDITLVSGGEPDSTTDGDGTNGDQTIDFGFYATYSLGNRIWHDVNNNGQVDAGETGIDGVTVQVYRADASGAPTGTAVLTDTTSDGGYYLFTDLLAGDYVVVIPPDNFTGTGALAGFASSGVTQGAAEAAASTDTTAAGTNKDHGATLTAASGAVPAGAVISNKYTLGPGQPTGEDSNTTPGNPDGTPDNRSNLTADFGFYTMSLGNIVWEDADNDGVKDATENGIDGLTVNLYADTNGDGTPDGAAIATTTTSNGGRYLFAGLTEGQYLVELSGVSSIYVSSTGANGSLTGPYEPGIAESNNAADEQKDHGTAFSSSAIRSGAITLAAGSEPASETDGTLPSSIALPGGGTSASNPATDSNTNTTVDFGLYQPLSLGNLVWHDRNNDGVKDAAENGIDGVSVQLFAAGDDPLTATPILTDTTAGGGLYSFDNLAPGSYFVYIPTPPVDYPRSSVPTDTNDNGEDNDDNGSQTVIGGPARSPDITLSVGAEPDGATDGDGTNSDQTIDFGFYATYSLGNRVWYDTDNDGQIDVGESGIPGVSVSVFADSDANGAPDLISSPLLTVTTDADGYYRFDGLSEGTYVVRINGGAGAGQNFGAGAPLEGYSNSAPTEADPNADVDVNDNGVNGANPVADGILSGPISLGPGANEPTGEIEPSSYGVGSTSGTAAPDARSNLTVDFGFYKLTIGDLLWKDDDNDGKKQAGESALGAGITVELYTISDTLVATTTTTISGTYRFERQTVGANAGAGFSAGDYYVKLPASAFAAGEPLAGYVSSAPTEADPDTNVDEDGSGATPGDNGLNDPDPATNGMTSGIVTLTPGSAGAANNNTVTTSDGTTDNPTLDFGFTQPVSLGNFVWFDRDGDGVQDVGEPGLDGATVALFQSDGLTPATDLNGAPIPSVTTGATGVYTFTNLAPGDYVVRVTPPAGFVPSIGGGDPDNDTNTDSNGAPVIGQPYVQSLPVTLTVGGEPSTDGDGANGNQTVDFGFFQPVSLGDLVWLDQNGDGVQDAGEPGINGATVALFKGDGITPATDIFSNTLAPVTTGATGVYSFTNLLPGDYVVRVTPLAGYVLTQGGADPDNDDNSDSNGKPVSGETYVQSDPVTLVSRGEPVDDGDSDPNSNLSVDFGFFQPVSLGNFVWEDNDGDGVQDAGESGVNGATVALFKGDGVTPATDINDDPIASVTTGATGVYTFTNLLPGEYVVRVTPPAGYVLTPGGADPDDDNNTDSNGKPVSGETYAQSDPITLVSGDEPTTDGDSSPNSNLSVDFGFYEPVAVGDFVWVDQDHDGIQDSGEPGLAGVTVTLFDATGAITVTTDATGAPISPIVTPASGLYEFDNLPPGQYQVKFSAIPATYAPTLVNATGSTTANDSNGLSATSATLASGEEDLTLDSGFWQPVSIGDFVWEDRDGDGVQEAGEPGIDGVTVKLFDATGATEILVGPDGILGTADDAAGGVTTTISGTYMFENLPPGQYQVQFTTPVSYVLTTSNVGGDDALDSDGLTPTSATLASGEQDLTLDAGFYLPVSIGNFVWEDRDGDGVQETGEPGINGVTVKLFDATGVTEIPVGSDGILGTADDAAGGMTTANGGQYLFQGLPPGQYQVQFTTPSGYVLTTSNAGGDDARDSDGLTPTSATLASGEEDQTLDVGFWRPVQIGDYVWLDQDGDGVQEVGEPGINGVTVQLFDATGVTEIPVGPDGILGTADDAPGGMTTANGGQYLFQGLPPGQYQVQFTTPSGYVLTTSNAGGNDTTDSDGLTPTSATLASGEQDLTLDVGFFQPLSLGNRIWDDQDGDGAQDVGEPDLSGAAVALFQRDGVTPATDANGDPVRSVTTGATGVYSFTNLLPGEYIVRVTPPAGYYPTVGGTDPDNDDNTDSNGAPVSGQPYVQSPPITLISGGEPTDDGDGANGNTTVDFGFYTMSLGNRVWNDANNSGELDSGETGVQGVTVSLYADADGNGAPDSATALATATTDVDGRYLFTGLAAGGYVVELMNLPAGYLSSSGTLGELTGPYEPGIAESNNATDEQQDHGTQASAAIRSGTITLAVASEPAGESDTTLPTGVTGNPATDANTNSTLDFGLFLPASLGNYVWLDSNNDGIQNEPPINGLGTIVVTLLDGATGDPLLVGGQPITTTTDASGAYLFVNLPPGSYAVQFSNLPPDVIFSPANRGGDEAQDSDADPTTGKTGAVTLTAGDNNTDLDAALYSPDAALGNNVWQDLNRNGVQDAGEPGLVGVTIRLYDGATLVEEIVTDGAGVYQFTGLLPNYTYTVKLDNPADYAPGGPLDGWTLVTPDQGGDDALDSDGTTVGGFVEIITVTTDGPASNVSTYDLGFFKPASLGDLVWLDADRDGAQEPGEPGIAGVTVRLYDGATLVFTDTTDADGLYEFSGLLPNYTYTVKLDNPADYATGGSLATVRLTGENQGGDDARDSDAAPVSGTAVISATTTGGPGSDTPTYDVGFWQPLSLGNLVWNDVNNNGVVDETEAGIAEVTVNLLDRNGAVITSTTTNSSGYYLFTDLPAGEYIVEIDASNFTGGGPLAGYASSTGAAGSLINPGGPYEPGSTTADDANDNGSASGAGIRSGTIILAPNTAPVDEPPTPGISDGTPDDDANYTVDFGVFMPASLGSVVWDDTDKDGVRDPGEPGVPGVTITLYDAEGNPIATTTTGPNGEWLFTNLAPGEYSIGVSDLPAGFIFTQPNLGGDDGNDSDVDPTTGRTSPVTIVPGQNDTTVYAGIVRSNPTAITLVSFTAAWENDDVVVRWETSAEENTLGFHVYRSASGKRAAATRVTMDLILARGSRQAGAGYVWNDTDVVTGTTYTYWLEEVERNGATNEYGPTTAAAQPKATLRRVFVPLMSR